MAIINGTSNGDMLIGTSDNDTIYGFAGNDFLDGGTGEDITDGGLGDDTHIVDEALDAVVELAGQGNDIIYASADYRIRPGVTAETLAARDNSLTTALALVGNEIENRILGNNGANYLDGGGGADVLAGYSGNDSYIVDNAGDQVSEDTGRGNDIVYAEVSYALQAGSAVETLAVRDNSLTTAMTLAGNEIANLLLGNNGANHLDGGGGADILTGYSGNDSYVVDNANDRVLEDTGRGSDIVYAEVSYELEAGSAVETLAARDNSLTTPMTLTGNEFANNVQGNNGANVLNGRGGNDILFGFGGADEFVFSTPPDSATNMDRIMDFEVGIDRIVLDATEVSWGMGTGPLQPSVFHRGSEARDWDDRIIYNPETGALMFDADGSDPMAAVQFALLAPGLGLSASDIVVITILGDWDY